MVSALHDGLRFGTKQLGTVRRELGGDGDVILPQVVRSGGSGRSRNVKKIRA
jgi:hypothetical protein